MKQLGSTHRALEDVDPRRPGRGRGRLRCRRDLNPRTDGGRSAPSPSVAVGGTSPTAIALGRSATAPQPAGHTRGPAPAQSREEPLCRRILMGVGATPDRSRAWPGACSGPRTSPGTLRMSSTPPGSSGRSPDPPRNASRRRSGAEPPGCPCGTRTGREDRLPGPDPDPDPVGVRACGRSLRGHG